MHTDDNDYLRQLEYEVARCAATPIAQMYEHGKAVRVDGSDAASQGGGVEAVAAKCVQGAIRGVGCVARSRVADETRRRTDHEVDLLILDRGASPEGIGDLPIQSVRVAIEIKRSDMTSWDGVLKQLASIKSLTRMRPAGQPPKVDEGMPPPRGNIFCGALFALAELSPAKLRSTWETRIDQMRAEFPALWNACSPLESVCDSGRYPNFFWGWGKYVVLKCYATGDVAGARPDAYDWHLLSEFEALSRAADRDKDTVQYYLGTPRDGGHPLLQLFRVRFRKEAKAFLHDPSDEDRVFFPD